MNDDHARLGYVFHPNRSGASLGSVPLDVFLVPAGVHEGFAPSQLTLLAWAQQSFARPPAASR